MKTKLLFSMVFLCISISQAQKGSGPCPYLGGSPFPPGQEPSLTHVVEVFWTTMDDMETKISIQAEGYRPTQLDCVKIDGEEKKTITSSIAPDCTYEINIKPVKEGIGSWYAKGHGNLTVRVYGFKRVDFDTPPAVSVQYFKQGKLIGKTEIAAKIVPEKFVISDQKDDQQENDAGD